MWEGVHRTTDTTSLLKTDFLPVNLDWRGMTNSSKNETKLLFDSVTLITLRLYYSIVSLSMNVKGVDGKSRLLNVFGNVVENTQFSSSAIIQTHQLCLLIVSSRFAAGTCTVECCSQSPILWSARIRWNILPSQHVRLKWSFTLEEW